MLFAVGFDLSEEFASAFLNLFLRDVLFPFLRGDIPKDLLHKRNDSLILRVDFPIVDDSQPTAFLGDSIVSRKLILSHQDSLRNFAV